MSHLEKYIRELRECRRLGHETSFYGKLETLINEIGKELSPKVKCIINPKNVNSNFPDGGFFTENQIRNLNIDISTLGWGGPTPERGVLEAKTFDKDVKVMAGSEQVSNYLGDYGQVLVTNYWDFLVVGKDINGNQSNLEQYSFAADEIAFWEGTNSPKKFSQMHEKSFTEYIKRTLLYVTELTDPKTVAWLLASYARDALERLNDADISDIKDIREKLQAFLGISFDGERGEHFFRSTLIQTIFYGVFAAWVIWSRGKHSARGSMTDRFDWRVTQFKLQVPVLKKLLGLVATGSNLEAFKITEILDWAGNALNRVNRVGFFQTFEEEHAVQYFYEPFLEAFDPVLRKNMGVWYTPREIVEYMVERVDRVLREELAEPDGLASESVYVLDPCCGTGAYLVEVLRRIKKTIKDRGEDALIGEEIKKAAIKRIIGLEILPASFVISHMEVSLFVQAAAGSSFSNDERPAIYLTNALTGWDPVKMPDQIATDRMFKMEWQAATSVKRDTPILVVLGNPPYNAFAGVSLDEEGGLVERYKLGLIDEWGIKKFNMDELYVRFFRLAERRIAEMTKRGIVCFISNFSYLSDPSFVVMRQSLLNSFDKFWFDCLNGDSRETGKTTPDGKPDPSVFSTEYNKAGIKKGTAIGLMIREAERREKRILFRQFWGVAKKTDLVESLSNSDFDSHYERSTPERRNRLSFRPLSDSKEYNAWPPLTELGLTMLLQGMDEDRGFDLISIDKEALAVRLKAYFDKHKSWGNLHHLCPGLTRNRAGFSAKEVREKVQKEESYNDDRIVKYLLKPLDTRWCYYCSVSPLWKRSRPDLKSHNWEWNSFIISRLSAKASPEGVPFLFTKTLFARDAIKGHAVAFPLYARPILGRKRYWNEYEEPTEVFSPKPNLSPASQAYLSHLGFLKQPPEIDCSKLIWMHVLAIGYSPQYLNENEDKIRQDWPRIPLPDCGSSLVNSAFLGEQLASLLDTQQGMTSANARTTGPASLMIARVTHVEERQIAAAKGELESIAGWGYIGNKGATMPGQGNLIQREYAQEERLSMEKEAAEIDLSYEEVAKLLGETTFDVYLNDKVFWRNIPSNVWQYKIGGYQVIKKWLSYRDKKVLGRSLNLEEVKDVTNISRRLAAIILLQPQLDENYLRIKESAFKWKNERLLDA